MSIEQFLKEYFTPELSHQTQQRNSYHGWQTLYQHHVLSRLGRCESSLVSEGWRSNQLKRQQFYSDVKCNPVKVGCVIVIPRSQVNRWSKRQSINLFLLSPIDNYFNITNLKPVFNWEFCGCFQRRMRWSQGRSVATPLRAMAQLRLVDREHFHELD